MEAIRGVSVDALSKLIELELVLVTGRANCLADLFNMALRKSFLIMN